MARQTKNAVSAQVLRKIAMRYPEVVEGKSCTKAAFGARKKNFLFVDEDGDCLVVMLKLKQSLDEATKLSTKHPDNVKAGKTGWVTITVGPGTTLPLDLLQRWIGESYLLIVPKALVAQLPQK